VKQIGRVRRRHFRSLDRGQQIVAFDRFREDFATCKLEPALLGGVIWEK
jgi:hypothetical protein